MKIMVGIEDATTESDIERLVKAGADEFFCGIIPPEWASVYGYSVSLNRREWEQNQFNTFEELDVIVKKIHKCGKKIAVVFNAPCYCADQVPYITEYFKKLEKMKVDALIISEVSLLLLLKRIKANFSIYMSGTASAFSTRAVLFYKKLGAKRILFPRDMSIKEIDNIIKNTSGLDLEYEAFIMGERCVFTEGYCRTTHGFLPKMFCHHLWDKNLFLKLPYDFLTKYEQSNGGNVLDLIPRTPIEMIKKWNSNSALYRCWTGGGFQSAITPRESSIEECGLCAIERLKETGITTLKVVSRGRTIEKKLLRVELVNTIREKKNAGIGICKKLRNNADICDTGCLCYYPEARRG